MLNLRWQAHSLSQSGPAMMSEDAAVVDDANDIANLGLRQNDGPSSVAIDQLRLCRDGPKHLLVVNVQACCDAIHSLSNPSNLLSRLSDQEALSLAMGCQNPQPGPFPTGPVLNL